MSAIARGQITISNLINTYTFIRYSNDGVNFTAASADAIQEAADTPAEGRNLLINNAGTFTQVPNNGVNECISLGQLNIIPAMRNKSVHMVMSFDVAYKLKKGGDNAVAVMQGYGNATTWSSNYFYQNYSMTLDDTDRVQHVALTFDFETATNTAYTAETRFDYIIGSITFSNIKIECGNIETPYSPAPEDLTLGTTVGAYLGTLVWNKPYASWNFNDYKWSLTKGEKGDQGIQGLQGIQGPQGTQGIQGPVGSNGLTPYFHIKYSDYADGTNMNETGGNYIGTYVDYTSDDSTDKTKYTWVLVKGVQGDKGDQGIAGTNGTNGQTSYLHIAYANSADGSSGFDVSNGSGKLYIGQYTDFTAADSTDYTKYTWSLIKGDKGDTGATGNGVSKIENFYLVSSSNTGVTISTSGWGVANVIPTLTQSLIYLWNYEKVTYTDGTSLSTTPHIISGVNAHIRSITELYNITNDPNSSAGPGWSSSAYTLSSTQRYLWNKERTVYVDGSVTYTDPHIIGVWGDKGDKGDTGEELSSGKPLFTDPEFRVGLDSVSVYNNAQDGTVAINRIARNSDNPTTSGYELQIQNTGSTSSPELGGCVQRAWSRANAVFIQKIIAKIPIGYYLYDAHDSIGDGWQTEWITPHVGTGKYEIYLLKVICGISGTFYDFGHIFIAGSPAGTPSAPVTWYIAYLNTFDMTATEQYDAVVSLSPSSVTVNADEDNKINGLANGSLGLTSNIICMKGGNAIGYSYGTPTFNNCSGTVTTGLITINTITTEVLTDKDINGAAITRYKSHASMMVPITPYGGTTQNVTFDVFVNQQGYIIKKVRGDIEEEYHIKQVIDGTTVTSLQGAFTKSATEMSSVMDQKVTAIQVGGRNLILKSDSIRIYNNLGVPATLTTIAEKYYGGDIWELSMTPTSNTVDDFKNLFSNHGLMIGPGRNFYATNKYIVSVFWEPISNQDIEVGLTASNVGGWTDLATTPVGDGWYRSSAIHIGSADVYDNLFFSFRCASATAGTPIVMQWTCPMLEIGTKLSSFSSAPEDVEADYNSKFTQTATNITAEVNARTSADSSLQSQITVNANGITQKVSQTDYNANNAAISTHFSQIEQTANNINLSVYQNRSIGKNVLLQTDFDGKALTDLTKWTIPTQNVAIVKNIYNGKDVMRLIQGSFVYALKQTVSFANITSGSTYLFSFYAKKNDSAASMEVKLISASKVGYAATFDGSATGVTVGSSGDVTVSLSGLDNDFVRHTLVFTANPDATSDNNMTLRIYCKAGTYTDVCMLQLESTELTGWGPSAQDTQNNIDKASADMLYNFGQAGLNITADGIVANSEKFFIGNPINGTVFSVLGNSVGINGFLNTAVEEVTFPTVATDNNRYFVDDKMNIFVRLDALTSYKKVIYLPNDYDYIGAHVIIIMSPFLNDTGELVPYGNLPFLEIRTGRNYMRHTYLDTNSGNGTSSSPWGIPTDTAGEASVSTNLAIQANAYPACVYSFIGKIYSGNAADVIQLKNGYIELLGVPSFIKKPVCPLQLALNDTDKRHTISNSDFVFGADDPTYSLSSSLKERYGIESSGGYYYDKNGVATECASGILKAPFCQWVILGANAYSTNYITD